MKRTIFDATTIRRDRTAEGDLRWQIAKLQLKSDELMEAIRPFAEAEVESESNGHFANAKKVYEKYRK